jgi:hypothetical protein
LLELFIQPSVPVRVLDDPDCESNVSTVTVPHQRFVRPKSVKTGADS